jgi:hypothetical protein
MAVELCISRDQLIGGRKGANQREPHREQPCENGKTIPNNQVSVCKTESLHLRKRHKLGRAEAVFYEKNWWRDYLFFSESKLCRDTRLI